ncbi:MAG: hypothetical protein M3381_12720 [Actinomycetota bacterium]|nr:hypothetical protein [Actinomycetota bacterium]
MVEGLAKRLDPSDVVYLAGRDIDRVQAAATRLASPRAEVRAEVVDVCDGPAVDAFASELRARHGQVDIVFSNAAARLSRETP